MMVVLGGVTGCERSASAPATRPADVVEVRLESPVAAARTLLTTLRATVRAGARGDAAAVAALKRQTLSIVDPVKIGTNYVRVLGGRPANFTDEQLRTAAQGVVAHWPSLIALYSEGLDLDHIEPLTATVNSPAINVALRATGDGASAMLRVATLRDEEGNWRPIAIDFVAQPTATMPVPASATAPIPSPATP